MKQKKASRLLLNLLQTLKEKNESSRRVFHYLSDFWSILIKRLYHVVSVSPTSIKHSNTMPASECCPG